MIPKPPKRGPKPPKRIQRGPRPQRKSRPAKVRKTSRAKMGRIADALFSKIVRQQHCAEHGEGCQGIKQCAHIVSRSYRSVRWDETNAVCLCAGAHVYYTHHPIEWERFVVNRMGRDAFDELKSEALEVWDGDLEGVLVRLASRAVTLGIESEKEKR